MCFDFDVFLVYIINFSAQEEKGQKKSIIYQPTVYKGLVKVRRDDTTSQYKW